MTEARSKLSFSTEKIRLPTWIFALLSAFIIGLLGVVIWQLTNETIGALPVLGGIIIVIVMAVMVLIMLSYQELRVDGDTVTIRLWPFFQTEFLLSDIVHVDTRKATLFHYGIGLKFLGDGVLGVMLRPGHGVLIRLENNKGYLVTTGTAEKQTQFLKVLDPTMT